MTAAPHYAERCAMATTDQGLDPILAALSAAGIPAVSEQTGGYCMVATLLRADGASFCVTVSEDARYCDTCEIYYSDSDCLCAPEVACVCAGHAHAAPTYEVAVYPAGEDTQDDAEWLSLSADLSQVLTLASIWLSEVTTTTEDDK